MVSNNVVSPLGGAVYQCPLTQLQQHPLQDVRGGARCTVVLATLLPLNHPSLCLASSVAHWLFFSFFLSLFFLGKHAKTKLMTSLICRLLYRISYIKAHLTSTLTLSECALHKPISIACRYNHHYDLIKVLQLVFQCINCVSCNQSQRINTNSYATTPPPIGSSGR